MKNSKKITVFNFDTRPLFVTEFEKQDIDFLAKTNPENIKKAEHILYMYSYSDKIFDTIINSHESYDKLREKLAKLLEERKQLLEKKFKKL